MARKQRMDLVPAREVPREENDRRDMAARMYCTADVHRKSFFPAPGLFLVLRITDDPPAKDRRYGEINIPLITDGDCNSTEPIDCAHEQRKIPIRQGKEKVLPS